MQRRKGAKALNPTTGVRESLDLEAWLPDRQLGEMSTRPDMVVAQVSRAPERDLPGAQDVRDARA